MINILKEQNDMSIVGQGGKIILFMLPSLIAAIMVQMYLPQIAALPNVIRLAKPLGYVLLIPGLVLRGICDFPIINGFFKRKTGNHRCIRCRPQSHLLKCDILYPTGGCIVDAD